MEIIPDKRKLVGLVEQAYEGKICLPDFQRDFVWPPDQIADLLRSILRGYFVGSLLLLRCDRDKPPFSPTLLRGAKSIYSETKPELLLLDGQQRLTSLIYALTSPDLPLKGTKLRRWFFIDLDLLSGDSDNDDIVIERSKRDIDDLHSSAAQYQRHLLPCTVLLRPADFYKWRDGFEDWVRANQPEKESVFRNEWRQAWQKTVDRVQNFEVPLVELPRVAEDDVDAMGRVCAIFEKLNSTGVDLSVYDLLTARLYRSKIALHKLWDEACDNNPLLAEWSGGKADTNKFGVLVLRTLALLRDLDPKPKMLISLNPEGFENDWRRAARAMNRALEIATAIHDDGMGVFHRDWLPNFGLLPVLAALRAVIEEKNLGESERRQVRQWYWCSVFLERFSSAVESKSRKDYSEFHRQWFSGGPRPTVFEEARRIASAEFSIRSATSNASGIYCAVFCLLAKQGARDWQRGEHIELQSLQDHHIFPKDYLKRHGIAPGDRTNTVVNRTLIADQTNNKIRAKAPADYLLSTDIFSAAPATLLSAHFVDESGLEALKMATEDRTEDGQKNVLAAYDRFLDAREALILATVREICGVSTVV
ncbi:MAG: DUF262 domain-containing protein [Verrucomicrobiota bacterium]